MAQVDLVCSVRRLSRGPIPLGLGSVEVGKSARIRSGVAAGRALLLGAAVLLGGCSAHRGSHRDASTNAGGPSAPGAGVRRRARTSEAAALRRAFATDLPIYCGGHRPYAALTFDDGPGPYTPLALRILRHAHVPATFFIVGRNIAPYGRFAVAEARAGDTLANHSFTHPVLPALASSVIDSELSRTNAAIHADTGIGPKLFRPPYGSRNPTVDATAHRLGLVEVLWNIDSADSLGANYAQIARRVIAGAGPGAIVLMHENRGQTIRALKFIILPALRHRHIRLVTVPELLALDPPSAAQQRAGPRGCGVEGAVRAGS
jgi:peptidoglycan/xylan/chitin deacetylase (PgdA/CDA1 family)